MKLSKFMRKKVHASSIIYDAFLNLRGFCGAGKGGRAWHTFKFVLFMIFGNQGPTIYIYIHFKKIENLTFPLKIEYFTK